MGGLPFAGEFTLDATGGFSAYVEDDRLYKLDVYTFGGVLALTDLNIKLTLPLA